MKRGDMRVLTKVDIFVSQYLDLDKQQGMNTYTVSQVKIPSF